jgi:hypothetical protein
MSRDVHMIGLVEPVELLLSEQVRTGQTRTFTLKCSSLSFNYLGKERWAGAFARSRRSNRLRT